MQHHLGHTLNGVQVPLDPPVVEEHPARTAQYAPDGALGLHPVDGLAEDGTADSQASANARSLPMSSPGRNISARQPCQCRMGGMRCGHTARLSAYARHHRSKIYGLGTEC